MYLYTWQTDAHKHKNLLFHVAIKSSLFPSVFNQNLNVSHLPHTSCMSIPLLGYVLSAGLQSTHYPSLTRVHEHSHTYMNGAVLCHRL
jgi:hypothetical protein